MIGNVTRPSIDISVPGNKVPLILGQNGSIIKALREKYNVKMIFAGQNQESYLYRVLTISGTHEGIMAAKIHVEKIINGEGADDVPTINNKSESPQILGGRSAEIVGGSISDEILVPKHLYSSVIGKDSSRFQNIKANMNLKSIEVLDTPKWVDNNEFYVIRLQGRGIDVAAAKAAIEQLIVKKEVVGNPNSLPLQQHNGFGSGAFEANQIVAAKNSRAQMPRSKSQRGVNGYVSDESLNEPILPGLLADNELKSRGRSRWPLIGHQDRNGDSVNNFFGGSINSDGDSKKGPMEGQMNSILESAQKALMAIIEQQLAANTQQLAEEIVTLKAQLKERDEKISNLENQLKSGLTNGVQINNNNGGRQRAFQ